MLLKEITKKTDDLKKEKHICAYSKLKNLDWFP